jgi:hypothetical protein
MKAKLALWLLKLGGILIIVTGLFVSGADLHPSIIGFFVPEYFHAEAGLEKIKSGNILLRENEGFQPLSQIYLADLSKANSNSPMPEGIKIDSFQRGGSISIMGADSIRIWINLSSVSPTSNIVAARGRDFRRLDFFTNSINDMKQQKLFLLGRKITWCGVAIEFLALGIDVFSGLPVLLKKGKGELKINKHCNGSKANSTDSTD